MSAVQSSIDFVNDFQVARQQAAKQIGGPFLQRFRKNLQEHRSQEGADGVGDQPCDVLLPVRAIEGDLFVGDFR